MGRIHVLGVNYLVSHMSLTFIIQYLIMKFEYGNRNSRSFSTNITLIENLTRYTDDWMVISAQLKV